LCAQPQPILIILFIDVNTVLNIDEQDG